MLEEETIWSIWQDANGWRIELKLDAMLRVYQLPAPETIQHLVELKYAKSQYHVYVDGQLVYTSSLTPARPSVLWFGNPVDVGSNGEWSSLEIDSILVVTS